MSTAFELARFGRSLGIVAVFNVLGPLVIASIFAIVVLVLGLSFLQLVLSLVSLEVLRPWLSVAGILLLMFTLVAAQRKRRCWTYWRMLVCTSPRNRCSSREGRNPTLAANS